MPASVVLALIVADDMANAFAAHLDNGALVLYADTTAAPATPELAVPAGALEIARFVLPAVAAVVVDGIVTVGPSGPVPALITGRIGWARVEHAGGSGVMIPNVGTDDEALVVNTLDVVAGQPVTVVDWRFQVDTIHGDG
jgi:hypothetical protein